MLLLRRQIVNIRGAFCDSTPTQLFSSRIASTRLSSTSQSTSSISSKPLKKSGYNYVLTSNFNTSKVPQSQIFQPFKTPSRTIQSSMTNKPRLVLTQPDTNRNHECIKSFHTNAPPKNSVSKEASHTIEQSSRFRNMAGIQKLSTEPTREHVENIRLSLRHMNAKNNDNQQITVEKDNESGIATVCIKSAAKNGISCKMMCDFLDVIDELYSWEEGKGVIIYGHKGFFCSGECCDQVTCNCLAQPNMY